ncbi:FkbM family methyltransferase [Brachyspira hyodysenteriae]|nr:FkbM family methyltransferase [Brachyspira hyodysenteriae]MDA0073381.1 FkbM family methyltransferase [Brachyspira hyodysenteriae]MDA0073428.1 FkbM family methyltransferase [Brachyspira hyodysenteriae]
MTSNFVTKNSTENQIIINTIDNYLNGEPITFLKADVEGEELNMLKGASETIKKYKPKMAISVYHKPNDLITIPQYIKKIVPEYRLALRHHSITFTETVLYCWTEQSRAEQSRAEQSRADM